MIMLMALIILLILFGGGMWGWPLIAGFLGLSNVTDKPGALRHIRSLMLTYEITPSDVETTFNSPDTDNINHIPRSKSDIGKTLLSYLGAIFIFAGISIYIGMFWSSMGSTMRIIATLGVGYTLFIVLISVLYEKKYLRAVLPLTLASALMMVGGWLVFALEIYPNIDDWRAVMFFICGVTALHWGVLFSKYQRIIFAIIALFSIYGFMQVSLDMIGVSAAYISIILGSSLFLIGNALRSTSRRVLAEPALLIGTIWLNAGAFDLVARFVSIEWATLIVGICIILTAYGLHRENRYPRLIGLGYLLGSAMLYSGLFQVLENTSVELIYLAVTASMLYLCVVLQSRALLVSTVLAMLSYMGYFSAKHFVDSLGWPITLVLIGIAFISVGTITLKLKRHF